MKKLLLAIAITAVSLNAVAEEEKYNKCTSIGKDAASIMTQRVNGAILSDVMNQYEDSYNKTSLQGLTMMAFEEQVPLSKPYKDRAIINFRNYFEMMCYKEQMK